MTQKKWSIAEALAEDARARFPEIRAVLLQLLMNRGITSATAIDEFLNPDFEGDLHDPFLFQDMPKAVERIYRAIAAGEQITVHGDYDADGVCGSVVLSDTLERLGAKVDVYLPHRETEGYGLNPNTVDKLKAAGTTLIITTDCGISNRESVEKANKQGIDVIITDHHHVPETLPPAYAILNPKNTNDTYPFADLAGSAVAYKLAVALIHTRQGATQCTKTCEQYFENVPVPKDGFEKWLLDAVAISTITDCMPLVGENRTFVKYGLVVLTKTRRVGLHEMFRTMGAELAKTDSTTIGFQIGPRLNAAGRLDHSSSAYRLLATTSPEEARDLAAQLEATNSERKKIADVVYREALAEIERGGTDHPVLIAKGVSWPVGVVGLVAGKITQKFYRPTFVLTENQGKIIGSGRSVPEFNEIEALSTMPELFAAFGGHSQACGVTFVDAPSLELFTGKIRELAAKAFNGKELSPILRIDQELTFADVNWDLVKDIAVLEPFGQVNPKPTFASFGVTVQESRLVGKDEKHLKLTLAQGDVHRPAIAFGFGEFGKTLTPGTLVDCAYTVDVNHWNGNSEIQLKIVDLRGHSI